MSSKSESYCKIMHRVIWIVASVSFAVCFPARDPQQQPNDRDPKSYYTERVNGNEQTVSAGEWITYHNQHTNNGSAGFLGGKIGNNLINLDGRIFGYDVYQRRSPNDPATAVVGTQATGLNTAGVQESGGRASALESNFGLANDNVRLGGKYLTAGVESGVGNGFKAILRGSVADGVVQAGPLRIGTSIGNVDTGASADSHGLEAKLLGNGVSIRDDKLELCISSYCGSVDPSPLTRLLASGK